MRKNHKIDKLGDKIILDIARDDLENMIYAWLA
jgi:hypothetical protein